MSAIDFRAHVESESCVLILRGRGSELTVLDICTTEVEDPKGDRVKITFDGKFLP